MQSQFWLDMWESGRTGFHRDAPMPLLVDNWPSLALPKDSRVLVPLSGKSLDLLWLAEQNHRVLGVELSPLAVEQFFDEHDLQPERHATEQGTHYVTDTIEIIQGDIFNLTAATLATCDGIYDRAAMIALPSDMRTRYAHAIYARLPAQARGLLITLDYDQSEMDGPPFSVTADNVNMLLGADWRIAECLRNAVLKDHPNFRDAGLTALDTVVYQLQRRP